MTSESIFQLTPVFGVVYWALTFKNNRREARGSRSFFIAGLFLRANIGNAIMIK